MAKLAFVTAALLVLPAPTLAQIVFNDAPAPQAQAKPDKSKSDLDKVECRSQDTLGSRLERRQVCMTKQQWKTNELDAKLKVHDLQMMGDTQSH